MSTEITQTPETRAEDTVLRWTVPSVDVLERGGDLRLLFDLPGVTHAGLQLTVDAGRLVVVATRADDPRRGFRRWFKLPDTVDAERIDAALAHGVLTVDLPARAELRPRSVPVKVA